MHFLQVVKNVKFDPWLLIIAKGLNNEVKQRTILRVKGASQKSLILNDWFRQTTFVINMHLENYSSIYSRFEKLSWKFNKVLSL